MAIVLATFILAAQEILDLLYLALLLMRDQTELNSLVAKNASYAPQGISHSSLTINAHFDVICDLLLDRCTATWNLFVNWITP